MVSFILAATLATANMGDIKIDPNKYEGRATFYANAAVAIVKSRNVDFAIGLIRFIHWEDAPSDLKAILKHWVTRTKLKDDEKIELIEELQ